MQNELNLPNFVQRIDGLNALEPISNANAIISNKKNLYKIVEQQGFYLPKFSDSAVVCEWAYADYRLSSLLTEKGTSKSAAKRKIQIH